METILITGGAGYIGSLLTGALLKRGDRVICLDDLLFGGDAILPYLADERYRFHKVNICDRERIAPYFSGVDHVIHLAAIVGSAACQQVGGAVARRYNVEATQYVFELAEASGAQRFIFTSTHPACDSSEVREPVAEAGLLLSPSLYVETKMGAERYLLERGRQSRCAPIILRMVNLFGISPRTRFDLIVNQLVLDAAVRRTVIIDRNEPALPFLHIRDAVRAILLALDAADLEVRSQVFSSGEAGTYTRADIIEMIRPHFQGIEVECEVRPLKPGPWDQGTSFEQHGTLPEFKPTISLPEGIEEVCEAIVSGLVADPFAPNHRNDSLGSSSQEGRFGRHPAIEGRTRASFRLEVLRAGPLVSIITPSYNQGRFIEETILSVLNQDYPHIEYLVVDGGSTDNTMEILKRYEGRLTWVSEPDLGQSHAINKGFRTARGEVLAWLNSDDTYLPGAVRKAVTYLMERPEVMLVYGEGYQIDEKSRVKGRFPWTEPFDLWKLIYVSDYILQQTTFFRRAVFDTIERLDETLHWGMDWDLWIRIGKKFKIEYLPDYLATLRQYPEAKTSLGGAERFRELVSLMRRHGTRRYPPAYILYGLETVWKSLRALGQRWFPRSMHGAGSFLRLVGPFLGWVAGKIVFHAQGYYSGGWVWRKAHFLLHNPDGSRRLRLSGSLPSAGRSLSPQRIRAQVNGISLAPVTVSSSSFSEIFELPPEIRLSELLEVTLLADWSTPHPMKGSPGMPGRASFQLNSLEVV